MRKPVYAICKQQCRRSACASAQSDQRLCYSLHGWYNYSRNFKTLANLISCVDQFESPLVANPEERFSRDVALLMTFIHSVVIPIKHAFDRCQKESSNTPIWITFPQNKGNNLDEPYVFNIRMATDNNCFHICGKTRDYT